jgi:hypothetical protein
MRRNVGRFFRIAVVVLFVAGAPGPARAAEGHALGLQAGWWNVELEYRAPFGLFVDVGFPWFAYYLDSTIGGLDWNFAIEAKAGYQLALSDSWSLRFGVRDGQSVWHGCPCADDTDVTNVKTWVLFEAGARFETEPGFVVGADLVLYAFQVGEHGHVTHFWPGLSLAFSQFFVGWQWVL